MPLTKAQKAQIVDELKGKLSRKKVALFISFNGVDVKTSSDFRKQVRGHQGEYKVVKKTLLERALGDVKENLPQNSLAGELGVALDYESEVNVAKTLFDFTKKSKFTILGGIMGEEYLAADQVKELALLPGLDVMRQRVAGMLQSPITGLVRALSGVQLACINVLHAIASKK